MAGLLSGALAGAIGGAGQAVQQNAQGQIEQRRQEALRKVDHKYAMARQSDQQQFQSGEREAGEEFTSSENQTGREHDMTLAQMREQGANQRSGAQIASADRRANLGLLTAGQDGEGNMVYFNPATGEKVRAPDDWQPARESSAAKGDAFRYDNLYLSEVNDRIESLSKDISSGRLSGQALQEARAELAELTEQRDLARESLPRTTPRTGASAQPAPGGSQGPVQIETDDEYGRLESGALFVGPDGVTRRKP